MKTYVLKIVVTIAVLVQAAVSMADRFDTNQATTEGQSAILELSTEEEKPQVKKLLGLYADLIKIDL
jgi:hypothetical protein